MRLGRRLRRDRRGSALIELAIVLPLLVVILVATIDFARVFYLGMELTNAARAGAQWGTWVAANAGNASGIQTVALNAMTNSTGVTVASSPTCQCATDDGVFSATTPANSCAGTCAVGSHLVITVTVTTSRSFTRIMPGISSIPNSMTLTRTATMRAMP